MVLGTYVNVKAWQCKIWMHYKWLFDTLATERICSAVLLNCTKARIEPLFKLNRTAASVASSKNGMPTFSTPSTQKKIPAECWRAKKIIWQAHTRKKIFHCESRCWKKISRPDQIVPKHKKNGHVCFSCAYAYVAVIPSVDNIRKTSVFVSSYDSCLCLCLCCLCPH